MKLVINGTTYEGVRPDAAQLLHLMELKVQSRGLVPPDGIGMKLMNQVFTNPDGMSEDDNMLAMAAMIFLSRRAAGDQLTFADSMAVSLENVDFIDDEPEEGSDEADPTPAADEAVPVDETAASHTP